VVRIASVRGVRWVLAVASIGVVTSAGCSGTLSDPALKGTRPSNVPKATLITDGDEICAATDARIAQIAEPVNPEDIEPFFRQSMDVLRDEVRKLKALGSPDTDAEKLTVALAKTTKAYDELERRIPDIAKDPNLMNTDPTLQAELADAGDAMAAFGFKTCGQTAAGTAGSTSVPASPAGSAPVAASPTSTVR
jgi:hypothetical protein